MEQLSLTKSTLRGVITANLSTGEKLLVERWLKFLLKARRSVGGVENRFRHSNSWLLILCSPPFLAIQDYAMHLQNDGPSPAHVS